MAVNPYYNKPSASGLIKHYLAITESTNLPIILYNVPSRTGASIGLEVYRALAKHEKIVGVKEASGSISLAADILTELGEDIDLYTGNDDMIVPTMSLGGKGCISVVSNILPVETATLCKLCLEGNYSGAAERQLDLIPIIRALFAETNPIPVKYALHRMGFCKLEYRLPLCEPSKNTAELIDDILSVIST